MAEKQTPVLFSLFFSLMTMLCPLTRASLAVEDLTVIILSQPNTYHAKKAHQLKSDLLQQAKQIAGNAEPNVILLHEKWPSVGSWTILPILPKIAKIKPLPSWVFFCEDETHIDLKDLLKVLEKYNAKKDVFLAKGLVDKDSTIIHHFFMLENFKYPDFAAGFALSQSLLTKLADRVEKMAFKYDFSIDVKHEFAKFIYDDGRGVALTDVREFCAGEEKPDCVTSFPDKIPNCGPPADLDKIFFAVKTCKKFHNDRVPVVKSTWAREVKHIEYYSDKEENSIPTLNLGVENTESGHCGKTHAILKRAFTHPEINKKDWLVVADDDTLFSIPRLRKLLACYDPNEPIALGERYGYGTTSTHGYDYITGGGGMVFSRVAVKELIDSGAFQCHKNDSPDDMVLGVALKQLGIPVTHTPLFHQDTIWHPCDCAAVYLRHQVASSPTQQSLDTQEARPYDYSEGYLGHQKPVSFHKHWNCDPYKVYKEFLQESGMKRDEL